MKNGNFGMAIEENESWPQCVAQAVIEIMAQPELSALPDYNREDVVASIAFIICDMCDIDPISIMTEVIEGYRKDLALSANGSVLVPGSQLTH